MTTPEYSCGTSMVSSSIGSVVRPCSSLCRMTFGRDTANSYPWRRICSIRMERCSSPRPLTRNVSVLSVSSTRMDTLVLTSVNSRSRRLRDVTYLPSRPANGLSLTMNSMATVGSSIFTNGISSTHDGSHAVWPTFRPSTPATQTISPGSASSASTRRRPSKRYRRVIFASMRWSLSPPQSTMGCSRCATPRSMRPIPMRPTYSSYSMAENRICSGAPKSCCGAGIYLRIVSNTAFMFGSSASGSMPEKPSRAEA